jgi:hypothetical protein
MHANPLAAGLLAWLVPGAGHFVAGAPRKGVVFLIVLTAMFAIGIAFRGELFAFDTSDPLVFLAALAQWALGVPRILTGVLGGGHGDVRAITYEYGNTFLIVGGLLNTLVVLDAVDLARGVKRR